MGWMPDAATDDASPTVSGDGGLATEADGAAVSPATTVSAHGAHSVRFDPTGRELMVGEGWSLTTAAALYSGDRSGWARDTALESSAGDPPDAEAIAVSADHLTVAVITTRPHLKIFHHFSDGWAMELDYILRAGPDPIAVVMSDDGTVVVVGNTNELVSEPGGFAATNAGKIRIFHRSASRWDPQAEFQGSLSGDPDFGRALAISPDGETIVVGSPGREQTYIYRFAGAHWQQAAVIGDYALISITGFGTSVALAGNLLAIGSPAGTGVELYSFDGSSWTRSAVIVPVASAAGAYFGAAVSLSPAGDVLVVGAPNESTPSGGDGSGWTRLTPNSGSVYTFRNRGGVWTQTGVFKFDPLHEDDHFGSAVAVSHDGTFFVAIGAGRVTTMAVP